MAIGFNSCSTNPSASAPNPKLWEIISKTEYKNAYVLMARYTNCTNFEGVKVMVYLGKYTERRSLDPHFENSALSPVARFKPTAFGLHLAKQLAASL